MIKNEEQFNQIQSMYYKTLMVKEQETKKFRHDIKNHLLYIYSIINKINNMIRNTNFILYFKLNNYTTFD